MKTENIIKVLNLFTDKDEDIRTEFKTPAIIGNKIYATDAYTLVCVDKKILPDFKSDNKNFPKSAPEIFPKKPNQSKFILLRDLETAIYGIPLIDEIIEDESGVEVCKECLGGGEVEWEYEKHTMDYDCPVCKGNGEIGEIKIIKTGNKVFDPQYKICLLDAIFRPDYIGRFIKVAELVNTDKIKLIYKTNPSKAFVFKIGDFSIAIMPERQADISDEKTTKVSCK